MPEQLEVHLTGRRNDVFSRRDRAGRLLWPHKVSSDGAGLQASSFKLINNDTFKWTT